MKLINGLTLFFYTLVFILIGDFFIVVSLNVFPASAITKAVESVYGNTNLRLTLGLVGALLIFISLFVLQLTVGKIQREKTIAFENPDGQVLISLSAIEDFIKRAIKQLPGVKELRPNVRASKRGVSIMSRATLFSDANIPETTEKIQSTIKGRIQDLLGIEEPVNIRVLVAKIVHRETPPSKEAKKEEKPAPFRGIEYSTE